MKNKKIELHMSDFSIDNPTPRIPVIICVDSTQNDLNKNIELNNGVKSFIQSVKLNDDARFSAEICIMNLENEVISSFNLVDNYEEFTIENTNKRMISASINKALELLEDRKKIYKQTGTPYYQPWLVLLSECNDLTENIDMLNTSIKKCNKYENDSKLVVFPVGINNDANFQILNKFSTRHRAFRINNYKFNEFFDWLAKSISVVSTSQTGDTINIPNASKSIWGE